MNILLVTYDLEKTSTNDSSKDYETLYNKLKSYYDFAKVNESSWLVKTSFSSVQLRDDILNCLKRNDRLFVANLTGEAAWNNCIDSNEKIKSIFN